MKEIGIFSRTYEIGDLEETYRRMTANGITHTQFNLSNAGLPSLPEHVAETKLEEIRTLTAKYNIHLDALSGTFNMMSAPSAPWQRFLPPSWPSSALYFLL